jgi:hypothetical protein
MEKAWYLITNGKIDDVLIVKATAQIADDLAEEYLGLEYEIFILRDAQHCQEIMALLLR